MIVTVELHKDEVEILRNLLSDEQHNFALTYDERICVRNLYYKICHLL